MRKLTCRTGKRRVCFNGCGVFSQKILKSGTSKSRIAAIFTVTFVQMSLLSNTSHCRNTLNLASKGCHAIICPDYKILIGLKPPNPPPPPSQVPTPMGLPWAQQNLQDIAIPSLRSARSIPVLPSKCIVTKRSVLFFKLEPNYPY